MKRLRLTLVVISTILILSSLTVRPLLALDTIGVPVSVSYSISGLDINPIDYTGLVGYWPLNDGSNTSIIDSSGNGNTGTLINSPNWQSGANCKFGSCLRFSNNSNQYANFTTINLPTGNSSRSVTLWIFPTEESNAYGVFSYGSSDTFNILIMQDNSVYFQGNNNDWGSTLTLTQNAWNFVAVTYISGSTNITLCVNTTCQSGNLGGNRVLNTDPYNFGFIATRSDAPNLSFNGIIDEVRIYDRVLSSFEISNHYTIPVLEPILTSTASGSPIKIVVGSIPRLFTLDNGTRWSMPNSLVVTGGSLSWQASGVTSGIITGPTTISLTYSLHASSNITIYADKNSYAGTDSIVITGKVTPTPGPNATVFLSILDPNGKPIVSAPSAVDPDIGIFSHTVVIGDTASWDSGQYTINIRPSASAAIIFQTTNFIYTNLTAVSSTSTTSTTDSIISTTPEFSINITSNLEDLLMLSLVALAVVAVIVRAILIKYPRFRE